MSDDFKDDTFLARWLNNELTEKELENFKASDDFAKYEKIVAGSGTIQSPEFDQKKILEDIKKKALGHSYAKSSRRVWLYGAAASVVIAISFFIFNTVSSTNPTLVVSDLGEKKTVTLPDGSEMILNANSQASFLEDDWDKNRSIRLTGEGYFKVKTGNQFTVQTNSGDVTVLGTQFNVQAVNGYFEVKCFEGSVKVESESDEEILKPNRAYRRIKLKGSSRRSFTETSPSWIKNESSFTSVPVKYVLIALENQYNIVFEGKTEVNDLTFSGTFPHDNLDVALKIVLGSLQIDYSLDGGRTVILED